MTDYDNMNREELMNQLNYTCYYRDELRDTLEKIKVLFNISMDDLPNDWNVDDDEHFGDYIYGSLREYKNNYIN